MDLIKMNCCWGGHKDQVISPNLQPLWQISQLGHLSQIAFRILRENRCLGLPSHLLIVLQAQMNIPIVLTMWISLIHGYLFWFLNPIFWRMYTFNNCHLVLVIHCLHYLKMVVRNSCTPCTWRYALTKLTWGWNYYVIVF
jgi:hypothetical protein